MSFFSRLRARFERDQPPAVTAAAEPARVPSGEAYADAAQRGQRALDARDYATAIDCFRAAVDYKHDDADAYCGLGVAHMKLQQYEDAADCFQMALHFRETDAEPHYQLGVLAQRQSDPAAAIVHLGHAITRRADHADAHNLLGACLLSLGDAARAATSFARAVEINPENAHYQSNLGFVLLRDLGEVERGAVHLEAALRLNPEDAVIQCNYSSLLAYRGRVAEVVALCDHLLRANPGLFEARLNRALALLKMDRYAEAWPDYEARKHTRSNYLQRPYAFPEWRGEALTGKTLLVYGEQGLGDEIMFASCLPDVMEQAARCVIDCSPRLAALFSRSFPDAIVHGADQADAVGAAWQTPVAVDCQVAAGSLPGHYRRQREDFPRHAGYLRADPARVHYWREKLLGAGERLKVGIAWRGGMVSTRRSLRSLELNALLPLLQVPDIHFTSLQHDATAEELAQLTDGRELRLNHWPEAVADLDETAALVSALDLVITVCSANVHLTGALGREAWVMVPAVAEWRYLAAGESMPWYPGVRMFRQQQEGDWSEVVATIAGELAQRGRSPC